MKKKFYAVVHFEGAFDYEIEADNEEEAKEIALNNFGDESASKIVNNIAGFFIDDIWEENE